MAVSKRLRYEVLRRDNHTCMYCGRKPPEVVLTVDHVTPVSLGGRDEPSNLRTACRDCNSGKSATSPDAAIVAEVAADADRWAAAIKVAGAQRQADQTEIVRWFKPIWFPVMRAAGSTRVCREEGTNRLVKVVDSGIPGGRWAETVAQFLESGLSKEMLQDCVSIAAHADVPNNVRWKYFCGCCRNKLKELQERAAEIISLSDGGETDSLVPS